MIMKKRPKIEKRLSEIAKLLNGRLHGQDVLIEGISTASSPLLNTLIIINRKIIPKKDEFTAYIIDKKNLIDCSNKPFIEVDDLRLALKILVDVFYPADIIVDRIESTAIVDKTVKLKNPVYIGHYTVIDRGTLVGKNTCIENFVHIGENTSIGSNVRICDSVIINENTVIGDDVTIYSGAAIGSDGFGYIREDEKYNKIRHIGNVIIEDNVEIGANTCIDRATLDSTIIGEGTKIDNLVQIGHNVKIGKHCIIIAETGISGSCEIGNNVIIGGQVGIADHVTIPDNTIIASKSGVIGTLEKSGVYAGFPAIEHMKWLKNMAVLKDIYKLRGSIV
jgi:UDP-3-O-[3-hydroxymyristoyl] glucosamine N-acyltransferase